MGVLAPISFGERYRLGRRAFALFLVRRMKLPAMILAATLLFWYAEPYVPTKYAIWNGYVLEMGFLFFAAVVAIKTMRTYFEYRGYSFMFEKEYFQMTQGYFAKSEISIAYHQIQHVNVQSDLFDQMLGICHLTLVMAGNSPGNAKMTLPAIGKAQGLLVQREIMLQARRHFYRPQGDTETAFTLQSRGTNRDL